MDGRVPPLGYQARDRQLVIADSEAETVRSIFRRYAELGSIRLLNEELEAQGITSKCWMSTSGRLWGGKPFARGALYLMLQNRIYRGEIVHKERSYPGEHTPIIDQELWDTVQGRLAGNAAQRNAGGRAAQPSLLAGTLFDGDGNRMTPSHAVKQGTRYRYYVSRPLIVKDQADGSAGLRIPAGEIEQLVVSLVQPCVYSNRGFQIIVPGKVCPPKIKCSPNFNRSDVAESFPDPEFRFDVDDVQ